MANRLQFKEIDGLTFYRKPYTNSWLISGIDICNHLGYKNPYEQAKQIHKKFKENFNDTSFLIPLLSYRNRGQLTPHKNHENIKEIRCYSRAGLWFFTSKCNIPKANKLVENLFKKFDKLIEDLNKLKTQEWKELREKGKEDRRMATDGMQFLEEYQVDKGSKNAHKVYSYYTQLINRKVSGLKKTPPNYRNIAPVSELKEIALLESLLAPWISQCIEKDIEYHDIYKLIKKEIDIRLPLIRQSTNTTLSIS